MLLPKTLDEFPVSPLGAHAFLIRLGDSVAQERSLEQRIARLEAERDVRNFVCDFAYLYDAKDYEGLIRIYADECVLVNSSGTYEGIAAIRKIQQHDMPGTEISFHHLNNVRVLLDDDSIVAWASAYMYNLAIREQEPYGTVATLLFRVAKERASGRWRATICRIAIDSRHSLQPKEMKIMVNSLATRQRTSVDLVGLPPRFPIAPQMSQASGLE